MPLVVAGGIAAVGAQLKLCCLPLGLLDDDRYRDGDPILHRTGFAAGFQMLSVHRSRAEAVRRDHTLGPLVPQGAFVGGIPEDAVHGRGLPLGGATRGRHPLRRQPHRNAPHARLLVHQPAEHLPHHRSLQIIHIEPCPLMIAAPHEAVAVGGMTTDQRPLPGPEQLAAAGVLEDLDPVVLAEQAMEPQHQLTCGGVVHDNVHKLRPHPCLPQLLNHDEQQHLRTGQTIGGVEQRDIDCAGAGEVPQPVELGASGGGAAVPLVQAFGHHRIALVRGVAAQGGNLALDGIFLLLPFRRDPRVEGDSGHDQPPSGNGAGCRCAMARSGSCARLTVRTSFCFRCSLFWPPVRPLGRGLSALDEYRALPGEHAA